MVSPKAGCKLHGMNIVITGASRGLGLAAAEVFAAAGHDLLLTARDEHRLYHALERCLTRFPERRIKAKAFDLSTEDGARQCGNWVLETGIETEVLINNAGSFIPGGVSNEPDGALEEMIRTNLYSAYHLTRVLLPGMMARKKGHVFNMLSVAALSAYPGGGAYSISKFALAGFSKNLRLEMQPYGIKVTGVYPGAVYTDSWAGSGIAEDRIMKPADVALLLLQMTQLSPQAVVEDLVLRPMLGDL